MSIMRIHKSKDYTVISNYHFKEKDMSLKAKGLLSLMLSLPNDWDYSIGGLCTICKENETAIRNTLKELEDFKYLIRTRKQNEKGQFEYDYHIFRTLTVIQHTSRYTDEKAYEHRCYSSSAPSLVFAYKVHKTTHHHTKEHSPYLYAVMFHQVIYKK